MSNNSKKSRYCARIEPLGEKTRRHKFLLLELFNYTNFNVTNE